MALKTCEKCGESVDEAKAFCPACGKPFVAEQKRESSSEFDKYAGTMNITQTAYNMMRSEVLGTPSKPETKQTSQTIAASETNVREIPKEKAVGKSSNLIVYAFVAIVVLLIGVFATVFLLKFFG